MSNNEKRFIRWKTTPLEGGLYALQITEQSHRGWMWVASNLVRLSANYDPRIEDITTKEGSVIDIDLRGSNTKKDFHAIQLTADQLVDVERALCEYNFCHSKFAEEWEIVDWGIIAAGEFYYSNGTFTVEEWESEEESNHPTLIVIRKKKNDEDKAREAFLASYFSKEWEIVDYRKPIDGESWLMGDHKTIAQHGNPNPELDGARRLIIRRKQPPAPTGEACVGCLCWVWDGDGEDVGDRHLRIVSLFDREGRFRSNYKDSNDCWWGATSSHSRPPRLGFIWIKLRRLGEMSDELAELRIQIERLRMQLVACGVAATANTVTSADGRLAREHPYWSAAYQDVCRAVDAEIKYREALEEISESSALGEDALNMKDIATEALK